MSARVKVVSMVAPSSGDVDFTLTNFGTPIAAIFHCSGSTTLGHKAQDEGPYSIGFTDGTNHRVTSSYMRHGSNRNDAYTRGATDEVVMLLQGDGGPVDGELNFKEWITDGVRLTVGNAFGTYASCYITCILIGGDYSEAFVGEFDTTAGDSHENGVGFEPSVLFTASHMGAYDDATKDKQDFAVGFVTNDGTTVVEASRFHGSIKRLGITQTDPYSMVSGLYGLCESDAVPAITGNVTFDTFDSDGFHARQVTTGWPGVYLALRFQGPSGEIDTKAKIVTNQKTETTKGVAEFNIGFNAQFMSVLPTKMAALDTAYASADASVFDVGVGHRDFSVDGFRWKEFCHSIHNERGQTVGDCGNNSSDVAMRMRLDTGATTDSVVSRTTRMDSSEFGVEFMEVSSSTDMVVWLYIEEECDWRLLGEVSPKFTYDGDNVLHHQFEFDWLKTVDEVGTMQRMRSTTLESSTAGSDVTIDDLVSGKEIHEELGAGASEFSAGPFQVFQSDLLGKIQVISAPTYDPPGAPTANTHKLAEGDL